MTTRNRVKNKLRQAWESCIEDDYCSQRINSERSLQATKGDRRITEAVMPPCPRDEHATHREGGGEARRKRGAARGGR